MPSEPRDLRKPAPFARGAPGCESEESVRAAAVGRGARFIDVAESRVREAAHARQ
jgi:hypothetical protein